MPGVLDIFTHENIGKIEPGKTFDGGGYMGTTIAPLASAEIYHDGQIVGAGGRRNLRGGARSGAPAEVRPMRESKPSATFDSPGSETVAASEASERSTRTPKSAMPQAAFATAPVKIDAAL